MVKLEMIVDDGELDLSMSELEEVPLKEIVSYIHSRIDM
jgi:hypothetical protein